MNTEEKARRYDEALNWMREIYPGLHGATKEDAEHFFPELCESEDERIRKAIIELLKEVGRDDTGISENAKCMIAYLEKQRVEENYDRMQPIYDNLDSFESALAKAWKAYNDSGSRTVDGCEDDYVECAHAKGFREGYLFGLEKQKELPFVKDVVLGYPGHYFYDGERMHFCGNPAMEEKQKEQKPLTTEETELNSIAFLEQMGYTCIPPRKEQKPAEPRKRNKPKESWLSKAKYEIEHADELLIQRQEELREIRELKKQEQHPSSKFQSGDWVVYDGPLGHAILQVKNVVDGRYTFVDNESTLLVEDSDKFLRPLTPKDVEKKVEWSEEDEATIGTLINYFEGDALDCSTDEMIRRIRALRPSWKPSEEQMKALCSKLPVVKGRGDKVQDILETLYYDLKKRGVKEEPEYYQHFDPDC